MTMRCNPVIAGCTRYERSYEVIFVPYFHASFHVSPRQYLWQYLWRISCVYLMSDSVFCKLV